MLLLPTAPPAVHCLDTVLDAGAVLGGAIRPDPLRLGNTLSHGPTGPGLNQTEHGDDGVGKDPARCAQKIPPDSKFRLIVLANNPFSPVGFRSNLGNALT